MVVGYVQPIIQRISNHLFQLISGLVTPKEWSLSRELTGGLLGLPWSPGVELPMGMGKGTTLAVTFAPRRV